MTTSAPPPSVLVLGTGELGTALLHALTTHPLRGSTRIALLLRPATLLSLPHTTLTDLRTRAVDLLPGDLALDNTDQLAATFAHFHTVIGATGMRLPAGTQRKVCAAALQAGVGCYFPWQFGVDYDVIGRGSAQELFGEQLGVREMLRAQKGGRTRWVVVSVGIFMSFLLEAAFGVVERDGEGRVVGVNALGGWDMRVTVTGVEDIGKVVAELVFGAPGERDKVVFAAGETVSYAELADVVERVVGREVRRREWSLEYLEEELRKSPDDGMKKYRIVFGEGVGVSWNKDNTFNALKGMKMMGLEEYAKNVLV